MPTTFQKYYKKKGNTQIKIFYKSINKKQSKNVGRNDKRTKINEI